MQKLSPYLVKFASLRVSAFLLVAFLLLTFWGVMAQANAEAAGISTELAVDRFFNSFFVMALGVVPIPAFKTLAVVSSAHLIASMVFRMPRVRGVQGGWRNVGLYGMHVALVVLLVGGVAGSCVKCEYNGFGMVPAGESRIAEPALSGIENAQNLKFFALDDSLGMNPLKIRDSYPYSVLYKGYVEMAPGRNVVLYRAVYDPFMFVPYAFMAIFLLSAAFHYAVKVRGKALKKMTHGSIPLSALILVTAGLFYTPAANATTIFSNARWDSVTAQLPWNPEDPVMVDGVVRPFDSFARGALNELYGKVTFKYCENREASIGCERMSAVDVVGRIVVHAFDFAAVFKVLRNDVLAALDLPEDSRYVSYAELNKSRSRLEIYASREDGHPATVEMRRLLENVRLFESIRRGEFKKATATPEFKRSCALEVFYNKANFALLAFALAFLGCILAAVNIAFKRRFLDVSANVASGAAAFALMVAFALRFYIAARPPLSSLYEIVLLVALLLEVFEFGAFLFCKKRTFTLMVPVTMMAAVLLFFAKFVLEQGDLFQPIPPVLNSSVFLTIHVFTIALGFAAMILSGVIAHVALVRMRLTTGAAVTKNGPSSVKAAVTESMAPLMRLLYATLVFGTVFSILGTLLGGVWADFAWGRFWGFDPKECGALFVCLWGMLALHLRAGRLVDERGFAVFNCFNVIVTFLCWFGINLLGVGLHSYGFQGGTALWLLVFVVVDAVLIANLACAKKKTSA